ncbi:hypothetical protein [Winogradskyella undariae]|uniref:hypothetical protein n=1 Tax=Winogradskyella undariae TaxID=1285465 RepID=UPI0015CE6E8D|nr:hypothetical protein [Winogradskyella undariae]
MKKVLQLIFIVIGLTSCKAQEVDGIWMSYNNRIIEEGKLTTSRDEGIIIDFDKQTMGKITADSMLQVKIDYTKSKILFSADSLNIDFKVFGKDSIEIDFERNMIHVFRPLNLKHKLEVDKNDIVQFLTKNEFQEINEDLSLKFRNELHFYSTMAGDKNDQRFLESRIDTNGYWSIEELKGNFFLIFAIEEIGEQNIYQITELTNCRMTLEPMQEYGYWIKNLTELKTYS